MAGGCADKDTLYEIGLRMGRAFQLIDDLLDYVGDSKKTGKPVGNDLREGKTTYPLLSVLDGLDREKVESLLRKVEPSEEEVEELRKAVVNLGGASRTRERALEELRVAKDLLSSFPEGYYKEEILKIMDFVVLREL